MPLPHIQAEFQTGIIEGKIFVDRNFNGVYDEDTDELYKGDVKIEAPHQNAVGSERYKKVMKQLRRTELLNLPDAELILTM